MWTKLIQEHIMTTQLTKYILDNTVHIKEELKQD